MLITIDHILTPAELARTRELLARAAWVDGRQSAGSQAAQVKQNQQVDVQAAELPALRAGVLAALQRSAHFFTAALPRAILPPDFNRHGGTHNTYGWHVDSALRSLPGPAHEVADAGPAWLRADISATLFLSDPADYEGGELQIEDSLGTRSIKGAAGSLVVYPSSSVHRVAPVTRGERLACFMFIQSLVRDPGRRRLLYDMDLALLELRQQHGESPATVSLTGCYHNLLRQWAETA